MCVWCDPTKPPAPCSAAGRTLEFDGYLKVSGVSVNADDQTLPELPEGTATYPFCVRPEQKFSSPPAATPKPRWSATGRRRDRTALHLRLHHLGHPRSQLCRTRWQNFHATDIGEAVTDVMMASFPNLMTSTTRSMEDELDLVAGGDKNWRDMLGEFYGRFSSSEDAKSTQRPGR